MPVKLVQLRIVDHYQSSWMIKFLMLGDVPKCELTVSMLSGNLEAI
jgi:hypothetical protein